MHMLTACTHCTCMHMHMHRFLKERTLAKAVPLMRQYDLGMSHYNRKPGGRLTAPGRPTTGKNGANITGGDKMAISSLEENMEKVLAFMLWAAGITLSPNDSGVKAHNITAFI